MKTDPVCGMKVDENEADSLEFRGKEYYFCSEGCRHKFEAQPERYAEKTA